jgi:hypothetical protein
MPVVALFLGVGLLGEQLTVGVIAGLILIALGAWLATGRPAPSAAGTGRGAGADQQDARPIGTSPRSGTTEPRAL